MPKIILHLHDIFCDKNRNVLDLINNSFGNLHTYKKMLKNHAGHMFEEPS